MGAIRPRLAWRRAATEAAAGPVRGWKEAVSDTELAVKAARLEKRCLSLKRELIRRGRASSPVLEPVVRLDYRPVRLKIVASAYRRSNAVAKEPFTVAWLERTVREGDVVFDIGANIGAYSLIAASLTARPRVVAVEPGYDNFAALNANIALNGLSERIVPLQVALAEATSLRTFRYSRLGAGTACPDPLGSPGEIAVYQQPILVFSLDDLIEQFELTPPTHLKVDVDGGELAVLTGARKTLASPGLRELMVEIRPGDWIVEKFAGDLGFGVVERHSTPTVQNLFFVRAA